jgi:hypothetical protein
LNTAAWGTQMKAFGDPSIVFWILT